jgi:hypothetical protein
LDKLAHRAPDELVFPKAEPLERGTVGLPDHPVDVEDEEQIGDAVDDVLRELARVG